MGYRLCDDCCKRNTVKVYFPIAVTKKELHIEWLLIKAIQLLLKRSFSWQDEKTFPITCPFDETYCEVNGFAVDMEWTAFQIANMLSNLFDFWY